MTELETTLLAALERMDKMHDMMMQKINHGASFYDAECLHEMNSAPIQAHNAICAARGILSKDEVAWITNKNAGPLVYDMTPNVGGKGLAGGERSPL
ncbi:MAG: hypothetical protein ACYC46_15740 [Acidobacteriaceae bacterium]